MSFWRNLSLGWKYGFAVIITNILFLVAAIMIYFELKIDQDNVRISNEKSELAVDASNLATQFVTLGLAETNYILSHSPKDLETSDVLHEKFRTTIEKLTKQVDSQDQLKKIQSISEKDQALYNLFVNDMVPAIKNGDKRAISSISDKGDAILMETLDELKQLTTDFSKENTKSSNEVIAGQRVTFNILLTSIIAASLFGILTIILVHKNVSRKLQLVVNKALTISDGDLTFIELDERSTDELGQLSKAMNKMNNYLRTIVAKMNETSDAVASQSEELMQSSHEVKEGSLQIAVTMEELSRAAESQASTASDSARFMEQLGEKVAQAVIDGKEVVSTSKDVHTLTNKGTELMNGSVQQMSKINEVMMSSVHKVKDLEGEAQKISTLVDVIKQIADQTNLLALNAAIEAARAGEHGKGFSVVAEEVRKLAEEVSHSVADITNIVIRIQADSKDMVQALEDGYTFVEKGAEQIQITESTFGDIRSAINGMNNRIQTVSNNMISIQNNSSEMGKGIEVVAAVSEEAAAGVEQTAASAQQTASSMEAITHSASQLSDLAEELHSIIRKFRI